MNGKYGRGLETMGASWFVSYAYYDYVDRTHLAWRKANTYTSRTAVYHNAADKRADWLNEVLKMDVDRLSRNTIGLSGYEVKRMAREVLQRI